MGKLDSEWNAGMACHLPLSNGDFAFIPGDTIAADIISADDVLSKIVLAHFDEILKALEQTGDSTLVIEILGKEVDYMVKHGVKDARGAFRWFLTMLALNRFAEILDQYESDQNKGEDQ